MAQIQPTKSEHKRTCQNLTAVAVRNLIVSTGVPVVTTPIARSAVPHSQTKVSQELKVTSQETNCQWRYQHSLLGRRQLPSYWTLFGNGYAVSCLKLLTTCMEYQLTRWRPCFAKCPLFLVRDFCHIGIGYSYKRREAAARFAD